ncbi:MarR family transcriptional regulator [uncultured Vibrio sp.]|uniref:MarR family winged helix-turn-helix transcriptional regulator n=1 Tax=uncultured Vibrio sp. TaxID=114054 RepID=UPI00091335C4|nr:MarR family transcriptional regulator [uncultured Vibrio sp.]OIQ23115.1 MAG: MarR family transcriptional regulator [Vibrio sp. MedPE-SWchi]
MLSDNLEKIERFASKVWRIQSKEDPIGQLSFNEYDYLKVIQSATEAIRLTDLAKEMQVTKPSATNMVKRLERKGLAVRQSCSEDARSKRVVLTDKAVQGLADESRVYGLMADKMKSKLSSEQAEQLNKLLEIALK